MKMGTKYLALFLVVSGIHSATTAHAKENTRGAYTLSASAQEITTSKLDWHDTKRDRHVPVKLYFPKEGAGPFPIIIFSHGLGGSRDDYEYLGRHWAGRGYVSVHIQHIGSDDSLWKDLPAAERVKALQQGAANLTNALNRPPDGMFAIDQLEALNADESSPLKGRLDLKSIGFAGHSFGGFTTLALAGETFILPLGIIKRFEDPRIKAAIQMSAPAPTNRSDLDRAFGSIKIPVMHMTGTKDFLKILPQTTAADRRIPFDYMSNAETCLVIFKDGDHFIFSGRERMAVAPGEGAQDAVFQDLICSGTTAFWDAYLKDNGGAKEWLFEGGYTKDLGAQATFEHRKPTSSAK